MSEPQRWGRPSHAAWKQAVDAQLEAELSWRAQRLTRRQVIERRLRKLRAIFLRTSRSSSS